MVKMFHERNPFALLLGCRTRRGISHRSLVMLECSEENAMARYSITQWTSSHANSPFLSAAD